VEFDTQIKSLVDRLNAGETAALGEIWGLFGNHIRRRARNRLREFGLSGKAESMDICNNVLLDMVKQDMLHINKPTDVLAYFCRAVDNQVRSVVRALLSEKRDIRREIDLTNSAIVPRSPSSESPSLQVIQTEILDMVADALGSDGQAFVRLYLDLYSWGEIAERLGGTPDAARMRWHRCVNRVRSQLALEREADSDV
jgi:DNA-directed RNA polymerase specialized sigma24 family protein